MVVEYRHDRSIQFISSRGSGPRSRDSKLNIWKTSFRSGEVEVSHTDWPRPDCFAAQSDEPSNRGCTAGVNFLMKGIKKSFIWPASTNRPNADEIFFCTNIYKILFVVSSLAPWCDILLWVVHPGRLRRPPTVKELANFARRRRVHQREVRDSMLGVNLFIMVRRASSVFLLWRWCSVGRSR